MKTLLLIILLSVSMNSQWINNVGYSTSKEKFENSEWRIYEGELQVHRNDSSFFYDIDKLKLNDKLKVVADTFIYPSHSEYQKDFASFEVIGNKFDKITVKILGTTAYIFNEKSQDTLEIINLLKYYNINTKMNSDIYLNDNFTIFTSNNKIIILNIPVFAVWEYNAWHSYGFCAKPSLLLYDIDKDTITQSNIINGNNTNIYSLYEVNTKSATSPYLIFFDYVHSNGIRLFYPLNDSIYKISNFADKPSENSFMNSNFQNIIEYTNYTFDIKNLIVLRSLSLTFHNTKKLKNLLIMQQWN